MAHELETLRIIKEGQDASTGSEICNLYVCRILQEHGGHCALIGTTGCRLSLLPVRRDMAPLLEGNWLHKFLRTAGFCLATSIWGNEVSFGRDTHLTERWFDDTEMCCPHV